MPRLVEYEKGKMRGIALKNHFYPTTPMTRSAEISDNLTLIGSVVLNNYVGGLNPDAVYAAARLSDRPIIVWFPTISAENFLKRSRYEIPKEWVGAGFKSRQSTKIRGIRIVDADGQITQETRAVLRAISDNNAVLATGHISWQESRILIKNAVEAGAERIIVTHPIYQLIDMPIEVQVELSKIRQVYIEQCYSMYAIDKIPISKIAEQIKSIGARKCIISSDSGQVGRPSSSEAMNRFAELLEQNGINDEEIRVMGKTNTERIMK